MMGFKDMAPDLVKCNRSTLIDLIAKGSSVKGVWLMVYRDSVRKKVFPAIEYLDLEIKIDLWEATKELTNGNCDADTAKCFYCLNFYINLYQ